MNLVPSAVVQVIYSERMSLSGNPLKLFTMKDGCIFNQTAKGGVKTGGTADDLGESIFLYVDRRLNAIESS